MPTQINQPRVTTTLSTRIRQVANSNHNVLVVCPFDDSIADSSITQGAVIENMTKAQADLFGDNSFMQLFFDTFREINPATAIDVIPMDVSDGTEATATITVTTTATSNGTLVIAIGDSSKRITVPFTSGDTPAQIAQLIKDAINARSDLIATGGTITDNTTNAVLELNAVEKGIHYSTAPLQIVSASAAVGTTFSITVFASGSDGSVDLTLVGGFIPVKRYQTIVYSFPGSVSNIQSIQQVVDPRFNNPNEILDGVALFFIQGNATSITTILNQFNSPSLIALSEKLINNNSPNYKGPSIPTLYGNKLAVFAAIRSLRLTDGASISEFVLGGGVIDRLGGMGQASRPYFNTPLTSYLPRPIPLVGFTFQEVEDILASGGFVIGANPPETEVLLGEVPTTYKTDVAGNPDPTFHFLNSVDTSSAIREYYHNNLRARFSQTRLTNGDIIDGYNMANALTIGNYLTQLRTDLANVVLVSAGEDALTRFKNELQISIDTVNGRATISMVETIVVQLREIITNIEISL
jgi:phage tail sheath gpL-like